MNRGADVNTGGQADARVHRRARARVQVDYHYGTTTASGYSSDISEGGMFLECEEVAAVGMRVYLRLHLPGRRLDEPLKIVGIVTRCVDADHVGAAGSKTGMGLHFEVAYAKTREQLSEFMDGLLLGGADDAPRITPADIRLVQGAAKGGRTFLARFPEPDVRTRPPSYKRLDTLRPTEVARIFAFETDQSDDAAQGTTGDTTPDTTTDERWNRIGVLALKLVLLVAIVGAIVAAMLFYSEALP
jgi:hypothetical protein